MGILTLGSRALYLYCAATIVVSAVTPPAPAKQLAMFGFHRLATALSAVLNEATLCPGVAGFPHTPTIQTFPETRFTAREPYPGSLIPPLAAWGP